MGWVECLCDSICFGFIPRRERVISKIETQVVSVLVSAFYSNMGSPLYIPFCPHSFVRWNCGAHFWRELGRDGGIITFVVSEEFPNSVNGGSERGNFQFVCVGKEVCTVLFSVSFFQGFTPLVFCSFPRARIRNGGYLVAHIQFVDVACVF